METTVVVLMSGVDGVIRLELERSGYLGAVGERRWSDLPYCRTLSHPRPHPIRDQVS